MKKLKTMTEDELYRYAFNGIMSEMDALQTMIRQKEDAGEDFHPLEAKWNALDKKLSELYERISR